VTRGTRPKKPFSSRGFAREARGAQGSWGSWVLKTEFFFSLFMLARTSKKKNNFFIFFRASAQTQPVRVDSRLRPQGRVEGREGGGRGEGGGEVWNECVRADASVLSPGNFITDATVRLSHGRPSAHRPIVCPSVRPSIRYRPRDNPA
jgi:hypothetical protein